MAKRLNWETANSIGRANLTIIAEMKDSKISETARWLKEKEASIGTKRKKKRLPKKWWDPRKRVWRYSRHDTTLRKQA